MRVIEADTVDGALFQGLLLLKHEGIQEHSRAGDVLVAPFPVTTVYDHPERRVLFNSVRDANPFFHLMEALWLLAGRNDARWLDQFVGDFSKRFAQEDGRLHGSYGFRWRRHFDLEGGGHTYMPDQLETVVCLLRNNPGDRQAVITMWDPVADLGVPDLKDRPCNTHAYLRVRTEGAGVRAGVLDVGTGKPGHGELACGFLDITVCCRSNDIWWGAYGANVVHFSILQEYLAAAIGIKVGTYYQISNNFHIYEAVADWSALDVAEYAECAYPELGVRPTKIVQVPGEFDADLELFFKDPGAERRYANTFFHEVAAPMFRANQAWKAKRREAALAELWRMPELCDWREAAVQWCARRMAKGKVTAVGA